MLRNIVREQISIFDGQKSAVPFGALNVGDAERIVNFFCRRGALRKVWGASKYAEPQVGGSGGVIWLDRINYRWVMQQGTVVAIETEEGSAEFTALSTQFTARKIKSERWRNRLFMVDGTYARFYENDVLSSEGIYTLGLLPPGLGYRGTTDSAQPDVGVESIVGAGNFTPADIYQYLITWYDSIRGIESLPNGATVQENGLWSGTNPKQVTIDGGDDTVRIDITSLKAFGYDTDRVTNFFVYRAKVTAGIAGDFKRIPDCPENGYSISLNTVDDEDATEANMGQLLDTTLSPPPTGRAYNDGTTLQNYGARFVKLFRDELWLFGVQYPGAGDLEYEPVDGIAYASDVQNFDYWKYTYDIGRSTGQKDTGMEVFRNSLCFFKENSIYALDGTNPDNYQVRTLDPYIGCVAPDSICATPKGIIALSSQGFILVDGTGPAIIISQEIFDEVQKINLSASAKIESSFDPREGKYECHVPLSPSQNNTAIFYYDVNFKTWTIKKIGAGSAIKYDFDSDGNRIGLLGDNLNSRLFDVTDEDQTTFNGQKILAHWHSRHVDFGHASLQKSLRLIKIKASAKTDFRISIDIILDFGQGGTISLGEFSSQSLYSTWAASANDSDGLTWDQGNWNGEFVSKKFEILASGVARNFQVVIRESETSENRGGFQIEELIMEGVLLKR